MGSSSKRRSIKHRHIPLRSCVACRGTKNKRELIRLVCSGGAVEVDASGKKAGRGAYLCPTLKCWEVGIKANCLEHALRAKLTLENRQALIEYGKGLS